jgi:hypothetical protein
MLWYHDEIHQHSTSNALPVDHQMSRAKGKTAHGFRLDVRAEQMHPRQPLWIALIEPTVARSGMSRIVRRTQTTVVPQADNRRLVRMQVANLHGVRLPGSNIGALSGWNLTHLGKAAECRTGSI